MKAIDILAESKLDEAPVGALGQLGRKVGAAALGALGAKNAAAGIRGKAQMGDRANQYYTAYRQWLGQTGKDEQTATYADVAQFMKKSGLPTDSIKGQKGIVDPNILNQTFTKIAQDYFVGKEKTSKLPKGSTAKTVPGAIANAGTATAGTAQPTATGTSASQPFSVPALLQVIPQMNKRDLNKIVKAAQSALQGSAQAAQQAVAAAPQAAQTTGMTTAQSQAVKQAVATNKAQASSPKAALLKPKKPVAV